MHLLSSSVTRFSVLGQAARRPSGLGLIARAFFSLALSVLLTAGLSAASSETGQVSGRIVNEGSGAYVRNAEVRVVGTELVAYSEEGGFYKLVNVPAGEVTISVSYTGTQGAQEVVRVSGGAQTTHDFTLQRMQFGRSGGGEDKVLTMEAMVVSSEREGRAKAIMEQRAALNAKSVVASDNYGDLTMGDVGEFLKYMPGMSLDFLEVDTSAVRIGGLDAKYSSFTQDGVRMAASDPGFGTDSRRNTFEQMSITGIETVEFNNTLTASMDADSPGGSINLRSKNAFDRKGRQIVFQTYAMGTSYAMSLGNRYLPDDKKHNVVFPAGQFGYADVFLKGRLGVEFNTSYNASFIEQDRMQVEYNYSNPDRPVITGVMWRPGPKVTSRKAANLALDFKATPNLVLSWRSSYSLYDVEFFNQYTWLRANAAQITSDSTLTRVVANATTNSNTRLGTEYSHRYNFQPNYVLSPRLEYKKGTFTLTLRPGYSKSRTSNQDMAKGFFRNTNNRVTRISWMAERSSSDSPTWTVTQLSGLNWSNPESWGKNDTLNNNILSNADETIDRLYSGYVDLKKVFDLGVVPLEVKTGFGSRSNSYQYLSGNRSWTFIGPTGVQTQATVPYTENYKFDLQLDGKGGNINAQNWRADDTYATYELFQQHPEYFKEDVLGNFKNKLTGQRSIAEQIDAAYLEGNTRWERFRFNGGLRYERTRTKAKFYDPRSKAELVAAGYPVDSSGAPTTSDGVLYQYRNGERSTRYGDYGNYFLSGGAKYLITRNLHAQLAMSESILRPDYNNLAGITTINESDATVTVPNPNLKPETSTKYYAGLQYYVEPAGMVGVSAYRLNVRNQLSSRTQVSPQQVGLNPDDYPGYTFFSYLNGDKERTTDGLTFEYSQQLTFLPGALKGLSVFGSVTRVIADGLQYKLPNKSANGGIRFTYRRFSTELRSTWQAQSLQSITTPTNDYLWRKERTLVDLSARYKLTKNLELMLSIRNLFNAPAIQYSDRPDRVQLYDVYGTLWNCGIKGTF